MFYNAIPIGMILKHASHTLLELLQYRCKTKTCSCNPDHPPHVPTSLPWVAIFDLFHSPEYRVYWAPNMQIVRSRGMIFMALKSIFK